MPGPRRCPQLRLPPVPAAPRARAGPSRCLGPARRAARPGEELGMTVGPLGTTHCHLGTTPESVGTTSGFRKLPLTSEDGKCTVSPVRVAKARRSAGAEPQGEAKVQPRGSRKVEPRGSEMKPQGSVEERQGVPQGALGRGGGRYPERRFVERVGGFPGAVGSGPGPGLSDTAPAAGGSGPS